MGMESDDGSVNKFVSWVSDCACEGCRLPRQQRSFIASSFKLTPEQERDLKKPGPFFPLDSPEAFRPSTKPAPIDRGAEHDAFFGDWAKHLGPDDADESPAVASRSQKPAMKFYKVLVSNELIFDLIASEARSLLNGIRRFYAGELVDPRHTVLLPDLQCRIVFCNEVVWIDDPDKSSMYPGSRVYFVGSGQARSAELQKPKPPFPPSQSREQSLDAAKLQFHALREKHNSATLPRVTAETIARGEKYQRLREAAILREESLASAMRLPAPGNRSMRGVLLNRYED